MISAEQVAAVRALLTRDFDDHRQVTAQIKQTNGLAGEVPADAELDSFIADALAEARKARRACQ